jgi:hypothetical protein
MDHENFIPIIVGCTMCFCMGLTAGIALESTAAQTQAVQAQCAQFSPTTGDFEWIEPKGDK